MPTNPIPTNAASVALLKKIRALEIKSKKLTNHLFGGEYHTAFKGKGMTFKEIREYQPGDDVRFIEWNVSARMGNTYSKLFEEERELSVYLLVDISNSNIFGLNKQSKKELITEIATVLGFSAINNNDKAGLVFFSNQVEDFIPAKKGKDHLLFMMRTMLTIQPKSVQTNIIKALEFINKTTKHKSIIFLLSDFADDGYQQALRVAAKKHDVIGVQVYDKADAVLPNIGWLEITDAETGKRVQLNTSDPLVRLQYQQQFEHIITDAQKAFKAAGADIIQLATGEDYVKPLQQFFIKRF